MTELLERLNCNLKTASFVLGSPEINLFACDQLWSTMETTGIPVIVLPLQSHCERIPKRATCGEMRRELRARPLAST